MDGGGGWPRSKVMRCGEARKCIYLNERQGAESIIFPIEAEIAQAEEHVVGCARCQEFLTGERRLKELLVSRLFQESAPAELRECVATMLDRERKLAVKRPGASWVREERNKVIAAAAVVILLAAGIAMWLSSGSRPNGEQRLAGMLVDDHAHTPAGLAEVVSSDHKAVESWFEGKIDFSFHLPPADDASLVGGKLCNLRGKHAALIFYRHPVSRVSLFVLDGSDVDLPRDHIIPLDRRACVLDTMKGYNVVMWKERGVLYSLVSDVGGADLLQLAARF
jgi:anti-sigma factor RsiW